MRNLKKALSLALASVMLLGMMVVGTSAATYSDVTDEHNVAALEVLNAVGAMVGADGKVNPDQVVTRHEAAVVISNLLGIDKADFAGVHPFTDVADWADASVGVMYAYGYTGGISATEFGGNNTLTGTQVSLMIMKALGYFQYSADLGKDWAESQLLIAKKANELELYKGISIKANDPLTRNNFAQIVLNALQKNTVRDTDITKGLAVNENGTLYNTYTYNARGTVLKDKLFKDDSGNAQLVYAPVSGGDDFGRPSNKWTYKGKDVTTVTSDADYVVTSAKNYVGAVEAYKDLVDEDYKGTSVATKYVNGTTFDSITKGDVVEFYVDENGVVTHAIVTRYSIGEVTKVDTKVTKAEKEDDVTCKITVKSLDGNTTYVNALADTKFAGFDFAKGDIILFAENAAGDEVIASKLASSVEGKITSTTNSKVAVDGTYYEYVGSKPALDAKGTFYLNAAGQIMAFDATVTKSGNYAYIYNVDIKSGLNAEGINGYTTTVYYVDQAGVKASAVVDATIDDSDLNNVKAYYDSAKTAEVKKEVVSFKINEDGEFETTTGEDTVKAPANAAVNKDNAVIGTGINATSATKFVFVEETSTKVKVNVVEGYKNVKIASTDTITAITDKDGYAVYAFVDNKNGNIEATGYIAVILNPDATVTKDDDNTYYTYAVSINGEDTTLTTKDSTAQTALSAMAKGDVFSYNLDENYVVDVNNSTETGISFNRVQTVAAENDDYIVIGTTQYNLGTETIYTIVKDFKDGSIDSVTVSAGGEFSTDNKITFTLDDGKLDIVFVIEEIK